MQTTPHPFGAPVLFIIDIEGNDTPGLRAQKVQIIPFEPKGGDVFTFESPETIVPMSAELLSYDLSAQQYNVYLSTTGTDWDGCSADELAFATEELTAQGWTVNYNKDLYKPS